MELRDAVISAVCARNFDLLPGLVQKLARLSPTEDVLRGSGIGHLVGDRHIWGLVGHTTQRRAAALQARWRVAVRQTKSSGTVSPKAPAKPFGGLRAKEFLTLVREREAAISKGLPDNFRSPPLGGCQSRLDGLHRHPSVGRHP